MQPVAVVCFAVVGIACSGSPRTPAPKKELMETEVCQAASPELSEINSLFWLGHRSIAVGCGGLRTFETLPDLSHGAALKLPGITASARSVDDINGRVRSTLGGAPDAMIAFPDGLLYAQRLATIRSWTIGTRRARISSLAQIAALGLSSEEGHGREARDEHILVIVVGTTDVSAAVVEVGDGVTEVIASTGTRIDGSARHAAIAASVRRATACPSCVVERAVITGPCATEVERDGAARALKSVSVELKGGLITRGLLTQLAFFARADKNNLLLAATPDSEFDVVSIRPTPELHVGVMLDTGAPVAVTHLMPPNTTIPSRASAAPPSLEGGGADVWLAERAKGRTTLLARVGPKDQTPAVTLDIDANMRLSVNGKPVD